MRSAPSVTYPVGRSRFWGWLLVALALVLLALPAIAMDGLSGGQLAGLGLGVLAWSILALRSAVKSPQGWLRYRSFTRASPVGDIGWFWLAGSMPDEGGSPLSGLRVVADLQQRLLLEIHGASGLPRWIWVEAAQAPADWLALRRALIASATR